MKSPVVKRSMVIAGRKTSVSLEDTFWKGLKEIAKGRHLPLSAIVVEINHSRRGNLSSSIRTFVFDHFRAQIPASSTDRTGAGMPNVAQDGKRPLPGSITPPPGGQPRPGRS
jgi:predicted DNA-binding ribbon-helix-helix protein